MSCKFCNKVTHLRPYGPGRSLICDACLSGDEERRAIGQMYERKDREAEATGIADLLENQLPGLTVIPVPLTDLDGCFNAIKKAKTTLPPKAFRVFLANVMPAVINAYPELAMALAERLLNDNRPTSTNERDMLLDDIIAFVNNPTDGCTCSRCTMLRERQGYLN